MENLQENQQNLTDTYPSSQEGLGEVHLNQSPEEIKKQGLDQLQTSINNIIRTIHDLEIIKGWMIQEFKRNTNV